LNARANQLAHTLLDRGFGKGSTVGICVERSIDALVGLLGILKTGAAYLPIDPMYPAERIHFMLRDARAGCLLTQQHLAANHDTLQLPTLCLDSVWPSIRTASRDNPGPQAGPDDVAYVMYTSGSTGEPKGTLIPHRAIVRLVRNTNYIEIRPDDRIAHVSNFSFDAATFEIWGALLNGATVVGIDRDIALSPSPFAEELRTNRITALFLTTSLFNQIIAAVPDAFATLRHLLFGGSAVDPRPVRECLRRGAPARLLHVYGPTENTTFSTWFHIHDVPQDATTIPIGNAISNTTIYVLDSRRRVVSVGVTGELYTGGDGLALGYLQRPELTEEKFVPHPFEPAQRLYRTGDLVRRQHDGSIEFLSRVDDQVKIRGFRAEPGEVETALRSMAEIRDAVVVARPDDTGSKRLLAYVTPANGHLSSDELRARLRLKLPDYMIPSAFIEIDSVPLTANGKPDYRKLPEPHEQRPSLATQFAAPATPLEAAVAAIWKDVLHLDKVGNRDNFFDLGGHSLLATQLISRLREDFEVELLFARFFENPTVAGVASAIEALQWLKTGAAARTEQAGEAFEEGVL
jgi:amino acid adenylation domain-containing protein